MRILPRRRRSSTELRERNTGSRKAGRNEGQAMVRSAREGERWAGGDAWASNESTGETLKKTKRKVERKSERRLRRGNEGEEEG